MKTAEEIKAKIIKLEEEIEEIETEFEERLEDEGVEEYSEPGEKIREEFDLRKEIVGKQIKILKWALDE